MPPFLYDRPINASTFLAYITCKRQGWIIHHSLECEEDNSLFILGRLVHQHSYERDRKELYIDGFLKIDIFRNELIAEIKKSSRHEAAARLQLLYYLYYLKKEKGLNFEGILLFPKERRREKVQLTERDEKDIESKLEEMKPILERNNPPPFRKTKYCRVCAFKYFCLA